MIYEHNVVNVFINVFNLIQFPCFYVFDVSFNFPNVLRRRSPLAIARGAFTHQCLHLFVRLFVCLSPKSNTKMQFSLKLSNLELRSLLTTYRKSYMGF